MKKLQSIVTLTNFVLQAVITRSYWLWFIVPLGLPRIGLLHAFGIYMMVTFLTSRVRHEDLEERDKKQSLIRSLVALLLALWFWGVGYGTYFLMIR